ncbi:MAG: hypothetical protein ACP5N9_06030 [Candidatus Bilamarchaeum sp.]|jgi:hypothetical protein
MIIAFKKREQRQLRKVNDELLSLTAINPNQIFYRITILSYVLSKIISKPRFLTTEFATSLSEIDKSLVLLSQSITTPNDEKTIHVISKVEEAISKLDNRDPRFVIDLLTKGKLKIAATLYAQGMSLGVASSITGLEKQEILDYSGQTMMFDRLKEEKSVHERMKTARKMIGE